MKNISKKIAIYDPYLDSIGGGEKHILSIGKIFAEKGYDVDLLWDKPEIYEMLESRLHITFPNLKIIPNFLKQSFLTKTNLTGQYEYFFYVTDGSYFFSKAKHNYIFCMVPYKGLFKESFLNKIKLNNFSVIANSKFTKSFIDTWSYKNSIVIYPYIEDIFFNEGKVPKKKLILSVGRFFQHLHSKRHDVAIQTFKKLRERSAQFKGYSLVLIGGLKEEDSQYYNSLIELAGEDPDITFLPNCDYQTTINYFKQAEYYWLFSGFDIDETKQPMMVEHFGITPLEAMAAQCITFAYNAGGPKEIITDGENGFLFSTQEEVIRTMTDISENQTIKKTIQKNALDYVQKNFSYDVFEKKVSKLLFTP